MERNLCYKRYPCCLCSCLPHQCKKIKMDDEIKDNLIKEIKDKKDYTYFELKKGVSK